MSRLSKIGAACLAAFGWTSGASGVTASYLVVAGGAGGGFDIGGGGGAGGFKTGSVSLNPSVSYTIIVGAGGVGSTSGSTTGFSGADSSLSGSGITTVTSTGGGGGGSRSAARNGANGGSGGGGSADVSTGGTGTSGQGNNGGSQSSGDQAAGGGGASAAGAGGGGVGTGTGNGGDGSASSITGSSVTYAGGGGGGSSPAQAPAGTGGSGGGGAGSSSSSGATAGTANFGGGGGGGSNQSAPGSYGAQGGSGVVIISYVGAQQFSGGIVTYSGGNTIHTFTTSGTLAPATPITASYLIVAGGAGGGGYNNGGGGGAGGLLTGSSLTIDASSTYLVTVGAGGAGGATSTAYGTSGSNSAFSMVATAAVGGGGGGGYQSPYTGLSGGSGGGGAADGASIYAGGSGTSGQGYAGGSSNLASGGGGGGASAVGSNGTYPSAGVGYGGAGGAGTASSISGSSVTYAGGGGGGGNSVGGGGAGGSGGGGTGSTGSTNAATSGTANSGGGGGGQYAGSSYAGGAGGSGVVIISYPGSTQLLAGGTVTIVGGNVIHTFKSTGYLAPIKYATNSLRFRSSASAYLSRTPTVTSNQKTMTLSMWVKRGTLGAYNDLLTSGSASSNFFYFGFGSSDVLQFQCVTGSTTVAQFSTSAVYRDPAAWYHAVLSIDMTQASSANGLRFWINGVQQALSISAYSQNSSLYVNAASIVHYIGRASLSSAEYLDGYLTEVNFVDGQALTPNSFGTFNSYGVWQPINYGGSYGTNGFYLPFTNKTSTTTLGYDFSPNGNNWTTNNISLTTGVTYDSMTDVPTLTSVTAANYCVMNPLNASPTATPADGNLLAAHTSGSTASRVGSTLAVNAGKWYWEATVVAKNNPTYPNIGIAPATSVFSNTGSVDLSGTSGAKCIRGDGTNEAGTAYGGALTAGMVLGFALDMDAGTIVVYENNVSQGTLASGLSGYYIAASGSYNNSNVQFNFGQRPFTYTPPSGYVALNTYNL